MMRFVALVLLVAGLAACDKYRDYEYTPGTEIRPGNGLFTGDDGVWSLEID